MTAAFWDKRSQQYDTHIQKHDSLYEKTIERTRSLLTSSDIVLDFACASGEMSLDIASQVHHIHGIDLSEKMIDLANQKVGDRQVTNITFEQIDAFGQSLDSQALSAIIAFNIFHLVDDAPQTLARLNDLLPSGGLLISQTPCLGEWRWAFRTLINLAQTLGVAPTIRNLKVAELESLVSKAKFDIVETAIWDDKHKIQWIVARKL